MEIPTANIGAASSMRRPSRIAFGSCNNQDQVNRLWPLIEERQPEAFIWGGDAVYGGTKRGDDNGWKSSHKLGRLQGSN